MTSTESLAARTAERFLTALRSRDYAHIEGCLDPKVRFRALIPAGLREAADRQTTTAFFARWFGNAEHFEVTQAQIEPLADRVRLAYRVRLHDQQGWHVVEQQAYCDIADDRIARLDLLCSGFRPATLVDVAAAPVSTAGE